VVVPGATHLFEEPGALEEVARLARDWFGRYLTRGSTPAPQATIVNEQVDADQP
jgi:hypothetical protein